jgi:hypothetical protein
MDSVQRIDPLQPDSVHGLNVIDMCLSEGCSAAECGLKQVNCNATSLACGDLYMGCKVRVAYSCVFYVHIHFVSHRVLTKKHFLHTWLLHGIHCSELLMILVSFA